MQEDFLHYLWKYKKFNISNLKTTCGKKVVIVTNGEHNLNAGPDFFNAQIRIGDQLWAGNVEIHLKSSDWYTHSHETNAAYDNVILHVVWQHDTDIFRKDNTSIDTIELEQLVSKEALNNYHKLFSKKQKFINCENDFPLSDEFLLNNWLERLYFERLEKKSEDISVLLKQCNNDWEAVLFKMLAKNFGLKVNGDAFLSMAKSMDFSVVRKEAAKQNQLEALLFGQAGLLNKHIENSYFKELRDSYEYQKHKYKLNATGVLQVQFFRLRPPNFPTIRLSQLASLYSKNSNLFSDIIDLNIKEDIYNAIQVTTSEFWEHHYTFNRAAKLFKKRLSKPFIDLLIINTIIPIKYSYNKQLGKQVDDDIIQLIEQLKSEDNTIINTFDSLRKDISNNALKSQALIELKTNYCDKNKCLQCAVGNAILSS